MRLSFIKKIFLTVLFLFPFIHTSFEGHAQSGVMLAPPVKEIKQEITKLQTYLEKLKKENKKYNETIPAVYEELGHLYLTLQQYSKSLENYQKATDIERHHFGPYHSCVARLMGLQADVFYQQGQYKKAESFLIPVIKGYKKLPPKTKLEYQRWAVVFYLLGRSQQAISKNSEAFKSYYQSMLNIKKAKQNHPDFLYHFHTSLEDLILHDADITYSKSELKELLNYLIEMYKNQQDQERLKIAKKQLSKIGAN